MKKILKFTFLLIFLFTSFFSSRTVFAADSFVTTYTETLENGDVFEIIIIKHNVDDNSLSSRSGDKTISGSKIAKYNSNGKELWRVTVNGTFKYNGSTSSCTTSSATAKSSHSSWKIASKNSKRSGNTATATATAKRYSGSKVIQTVTKSVTLSCSKSGKLS